MVQLLAGSPSVITVRDSVCLEKIYKVKHFVSLSQSLMPFREPDEELLLSKTSRQTGTHAGGGRGATGDAQTR